MERLLTDHSIVVCGSQHPLRNLSGKQLGAEALLKQPWIGFGPFMPTMKGFQSLFSSDALEGLPRLLETSSLDSTISELRSNRYLAVLPRELIRAELEASELIELPITLDPIEGWDISIIRMTEHPLSPAVQDFLDCLRGVARSDDLTTA